MLNAPTYLLKSLQNYSTIILQGNKKTISMVSGLIFVKAFA